MANTNSANVSMLLGNNGGRQLRGGGRTSGWERSQYSVAVGDFNGDGKPDLAVANFYAPAMCRLLKGTATAVLRPRSTSGVGVNPYSVAVGDFNGDGKPDLAVANYDYGQRVDTAGNGERQLSGAATNFAVGTYPYSVAVGDFNGDGKPDLAVANEATATTSRCCWATGTGSFGAADQLRGGRSTSVFRGGGGLQRGREGRTWHWRIKLPDNVSVLLGNGNGRLRDGDRTSRSAVVPVSWRWGTSTGTASRIWRWRIYGSEQRVGAAGQRTGSFEAAPTSPCGRRSAIRGGGGLQRGREARSGDCEHQQQQRLDSAQHHGGESADGDHADERFPHGDHGDARWQRDRRRTGGHYEPRRGVRTDGIEPRSSDWWVGGFTGRRHSRDPRRIYDSRDPSVAATGYSFRAYATNSIGTSYTTVSTFTTLAAAPTVTSPTSSSITATTATLGGDVTADGGSTITERGVVYSQTATNNNPLIGGTGVTKAPVSGTTGLFAAGVTGLAPATSHSFKAFATNAVGTSYTSVATFTTTCPVITLAKPAERKRERVPYTGSATASGGTGPYTYAVTSGIPSGRAVTDRLGCGGGERQRDSHDHGNIPVRHHGDRHLRGGDVHGSAELQRGDRPRAGPGLLHAHPVPRARHAESGRTARRPGAGGAGGSELRGGGDVRDSRGREGDLAEHRGDRAHESPGTSGSTPAGRRCRWYRRSTTRQDRRDRTTR